MSNLRRLRAVTEWMADWRCRPNLEPWMLFNLCYALRHLGRYPQANEVAQYAVEKALAGSIAEAVEHLQKVRARSDVAYDQRLLAIAKALVEFQQAAPETRRQQFKFVRQKLGKLFTAQETLKAGADVRRTLRRARQVFVHNGAGPLANLWFFWKLYWQWSLLVPFLLPFLAPFLPK